MIFTGSLGFIPSAYSNCEFFASSSYLFIGMEKFDQEKHDQEVAERYARIAVYDAFDKLVDMALDGVITMEDAKKAWESETVVVRNLTA